LAVDMDCTCTALRDAAAKFGASEIELLAKYPKQRLLWVHLDSFLFAINRKRGDHCILPKLDFCH
jgi:hypothetical protein